MSEAVKNLPCEIANIFAGRELHLNSVTPWKGLGGSSFIYDFAFAPGYANIFHNNVGLIRVSIDNENAYIDLADSEKAVMEVILFDHRFRRAGIKMRKISGKTPAEVVKKLVAWFAKNADAMNAVQFPVA